MRAEYNWLRKTEIGKLREHMRHVVVVADGMDLSPEIRHHLTEAFSMIRHEYLATAAKKP